jgi:hypothetical protein
MPTQPVPEPAPAPEPEDPNDCAVTLGLRVDFVVADNNDCASMPCQVRAAPRDVHSDKVQV